MIQRQEQRLATSSEEAAGRSRYKGDRDDSECSQNFFLKKANSLYRLRYWVLVMRSCVLNNEPF